MKNKMMKIMISMMIVLAFSFNVHAKKITFQSSNPYDFIHILDGLENDPDAKVYGNLSIPKSDSKVPAIVFLHGAGGYKSEKYGKWMKMFSRMGIATFALESFKGRKAKSIKVTRTMMTVDALMALKVLSNHPKIDKDRIGVMGASKGGGVAMFTAWEPIRQAVVGDLKFAFHLALYPSCYEWEKVEFSKAPILILIGEKDTWTPTEFCIDFIDSLTKAGHVNAEIIVYPGAYHVFDAHYELQTFSKGLDMTDCRINVKASGESELAGFSLSKADTRMKALKKCLKRGNKAGLNSKAKEMAMKDVKAFVTKSFGP